MKGWGGVQRERKKGLVVVVVVVVRGGYKGENSRARISLTPVALIQ